MNTTELFAEQVIAGMLVMLAGGLVFFWPLLNVYNQYVGSAEYLEQIIAAGLVVATAYLIGMVYDRVADTLLQDLESHCRLRFAFGKLYPKCVDEQGLPTRDPFEENRYRMVVLDNPQATEHMEYLRSRIRLTRVMTVSIPGLTMALLLALDWGHASRWWGLIALMIPLVYLAMLTLKVIRRWAMFERPPKTYHLVKLRDYYTRRTRMIPKSCDRKAAFRWLFCDEAWIGLLLLLVSASVLIVSTRSWVRFWIPATGLVLTLLVGWVWWRISITFYTFLCDFNDYRPVVDQNPN